jgi:hypothetical protein
MQNNLPQKRRPAEHPRMIPFRLVSKTRNLAAQVFLFSLRTPGMHKKRDTTPLCE